MSESTFGPDLNPSIEYAFLHDESLEALGDATQRDTVAYMIGREGHTLVVAAGIAELSPDDQRLVIITDYWGSDEGGDSRDQGHVKTLTVVGDMDPLLLSAAGYDGEHRSPLAQQQDADLYDQCRRLIRNTDFNKEWAERLINGPMHGSLGELTADMGPAPATTEEVDFSETPQLEQSEIRQARIRRAATRISALVRKIITR